MNKAMVLKKHKLLFFALLVVLMPLLVLHINLVQSVHMLHLQVSNWQQKLQAVSREVFRKESHDLLLKKVVIRDQQDAKKRMEHLANGIAAVNRLSDFDLSFDTGTTIDYRGGQLLLLKMRLGFVAPRLDSALVALHDFIDGVEGLNLIVDFQALNQCAEGWQVKLIFDCYFLYAR